MEYDSWRGNIRDGGSELRNLVLRPPSAYDSPQNEYGQVDNARVSVIQQRASRTYQESQYKANCTSLFYGVDLESVYLNALEALFESEDRPLWWIAQNQVEIGGWDNPPECKVRLYIHPFNVTAWIEHVRNYTQPPPRV
jgi:hypothetical protein